LEGCTKGGSSLTEVNQVVGVVRQAHDNHEERSRAQAWAAIHDNMGNRRNYTLEDFALGAETFNRFNSGSSVEPGEHPENSWDVMERAVVDGI
jgi:hypothetical protein